MKRGLPFVLMLLVAALFSAGWYARSGLEIEIDASSVAEVQATLLDLRGWVTGRGWLAPPVFERRSLNLAVHSGYAAVGIAMRRFRRLGTWLGRSVSRLDRFLLKRGTRTPNHSLLVLAKE